MLSRLLYVSPQLLRRGVPFFTLYLVLFAALTLADGLSLTLFVQGVGADSLPFYHGISAGCVLTAAIIYLQVVDRFHPSRVFMAILAGPMLLFGGVWLLVVCVQGGNQWLGMLFVGRELAFALILLHFGTYLQQYFTRVELGRVMPVVYAGGRVGGIIGGVLLERLSLVIEPIDLLLVAVGTLLLGLAGAELIHRRLSPVEECHPDSNAAPATHEDERLAVSSVGGFLRFVAKNPLMFWITVTTIAYFGCRSFLNFRYSHCFESAFASETEMAQFIGRYTTYALLGSLALQLFVISRLVAWAGLKTAHLTYAALLTTAAFMGAFEMTLATAVFARLIESELRYGLRNPTAQLILNQFSRALRIRARVWSIGFLIPLSTLAASFGLAGLIQWDLSRSIGLATACLGVLYLLSSLGLARHCQPAKRGASAEPTLLSVPRNEPNFNTPTTVASGAPSKLPKPQAHPRAA